MLRTLDDMKKKYCFDYIREDVMKWAPDVRKNVTKQMLYMLPLRVMFPFILPEQITPPIDYYGEVIDNYDEWKRQREVYIEELYKQLKIEKNMRKILTVKELITLLLDYNMDALVYTNANGVPTGISLPNVCYGGGSDGETKKDCKEVIFDIQEEENEHIAVALEEFVDPYNGHAYVDLGLPSGTKWAKMNVGASSEKEAGLYFAWGETQGYADASTKAFSWSDYKFNPSGDGSTFTKYNSTDGKTVLDLEDDAAHVNMGGDWHMPNRAQCLELLKETKNGFVTNTGAFTQFAWSDSDGTSTETETTATISDWNTAGFLFFKSDVSDINAAITSGDYLFIPAAGYCGDGGVGDVGFGGSVWASALYSENVKYAWGFGFGSGRAGVGDGGRFYGLSVRGVVSLVEKNIRRKV